MKVYGVIMAGGGGTRFWPLSRVERPKQLLNLSGKDVMINDTLKRMKPTIKIDDTFIVTNVNQVEHMRKVLIKEFAQNKLIAEPSARNTAACIGYAAIKIIKQYGDGIMCIFPSDSYILDEEEFNHVLQKSIKVAEKGDFLVTIGIKPTFPSTGYGYIKYSDNMYDAKKVDEFVEKPDIATAEQYIESREYLWNSGMFIWKASVIMNQFKKFLPEIYEDLCKIEDALGTPFEQEVVDKVYPQIQSISIDYGIMEKADNVYVLEGNFGWSDVGSFDSLNAIHPEDEDGNIIIGKHINIDTTNSIAYSNGRLIATIGVDNTIIVETEDAILVCDKKRAQDIKNVVSQLQPEYRELL